MINSLHLFSFIPRNSKARIIVNHVDEHGEFVEIGNWRILRPIAGATLQSQLPEHVEIDVRHVSVIPMRHANAGVLDGKFDTSVKEQRGPVSVEERLLNLEAKARKAQMRADRREKRLREQLRLSKLSAPLSMDHSKDDPKDDPNPVAVGEPTGDD